MRRQILVLVAVVLLIAGFAGWQAVRHAPAPAAKPAIPSAAPNPVAAQVPAVLTEAEQRHLAEVACGQPSVKAAKGVFGCGICPEGSDEMGDAYSTEAQWTLGSAIAGHFTAANRQEALLRIEGCESHAMGMGGDFLLRHEAGSWKRVRYIQSGPANADCKKLLWTAGRDALLCTENDMHQGQANTLVRLLTVGATAPPASEDAGTVLNMVSDESDCDFRHGQTIQQSGVDAVNLLPAAASGQQDFEVLVSLGRTTNTSSSEDCPSPDRSKYRFVFHRLAESFQADAGNPRLALAGDEYSFQQPPVIHPLKY